MNLFIESDNWSDFSLSSNDWKLVESVASLLKLFCETVQVFESESKPTMHRVIERIFTLNENLGSFIIKNQSNKAAVQFAKELKYNLRSRYPSHASENKIRRVANYLAPQYKGIHLHETKKIEETKIDIKLMALKNNDSIPVDDSSLVGEENVELSPTTKLDGKKYSQQQ